MNTHSQHTRRRLLAATGTIAALALAGCSSTGDDAPAGDAAASVWIIDGVTVDTFQNSFDSWNTDNPDRPFAVESFANDPYKQKIRTAIGAGNAPTLIYGWGGGGLREYVDNESVLDLSDTIGADADLQSRFLPAIAEIGVLDGKTFAVPNNGMKPVMFYYNKDVFEKAGVDVPESWDDLMSDIPKFRDEGIAPIAVAGQAKWPLLPWFGYLVDRIGGPEVMQAIEAREPDAWSDPAVLEAAEMIQDLVDAGGFIDGFASVSTESGADSALVQTGKAAMILGLPSTYQTLAGQNPDFVKDGHLGYFPFPAVEGGAGDPSNVVGNPSNYWSVSATATADEQKTAIDYLTSHLLDDSYVDDLLAAGNVPPVAGIEDKIATSSDPDYFGEIYRVSQEASHFQLSLDQAVDPNQAEALLTNLQLVFLGQSTPEQFAETMNASLEG